jgi:hypothetical protein
MLPILSSLFPGHPTVQITTPNVAVIKNVIIDANDRVKADIQLSIPEGAKTGDRYRLTIMQREGQEIIGGSTYEIRIQ